MHLRELHSKMLGLAYQQFKRAGMDSCGLTQLASRTVGVPFVGLVAGCLMMSELLVGWMGRYQGMIRTTQR